MKADRRWLSTLEGQGVAGNVLAAAVRGADRRASDARSARDICLVIAVIFAAVAALVWVMGRESAWQLEAYLVGLALALAAHNHTVAEKLSFITDEAHDAAQRRYKAFPPKEPAMHTASTSDRQSKAQVAQPIAWTPSGSPLGSVLLENPLPQRLTAASYWEALADRINRIAAADPEGARAAAREVERQEPLIRLAPSLGAALVCNSEWLRERVAFPDAGIPADAIQHDAATLEFLTGGDDAIGEFIAALYHDPDA